MALINSYGLQSKITYMLSFGIGYFGVELIRKIIVRWIANEWINLFVAVLIAGILALYLLPQLLWKLLFDR